jgi:hypothetical protein
MNYQYFAESTAWMTAIQDHALKDDDIFYVRYVGTSSTRTGYARFQEDLLRKTSGIYGRFVGALIRLYPEQFAKIEVYEIIHADISVSSAIPDIPGAKEQVLMEDFNRTSTKPMASMGGSWKPLSVFIQTSLRKSKSMR